GAPIAFRYDLHTPRTVERPDLTARGVQRQAEALVGETSYEPAPAEAAPPATEMADKKMKEEGRYDAPTRRVPAPKTVSRAPRAGAAPSPPPAPMGSSAGYGRGGMAPADEDSEQQTIDYDSLRRTTLAQAKAQTVSGQTRFELGERVTVPEGTSTMVAIINADVEGEETFLFKPGGAGMGYESNPYRVVKFKNSTPFVLEPGPIGIYSNGSFVGEGLSETVGAATSATIPFAVETGIMVTSTRADDRDEMRLIKMSRGVLEVEQFARRTTIYTVKSQTLDQGFTTLIRHPRTGTNFILADRPAGTEDLPDAYVVRLTIAKGAREGTITLVEQTPSRSTITIWNKPAIELLEKLLVHADVGADTKKKLKPIIDKRREVAKIEEQIAGITDRRNQIDQRAGQIRAALDSLSKNPQGATQRAKFAKQLDDFTSEGNRLGVQLADLEAKRLDRRVELEDALQDLEITAPPAKKAPAPAKP
nr:hypothetical protein [Deltaproteobacteria bacterium]